MPGKNFPFTTRVEPVSPPKFPALNGAGEMVEAPGTAPGSTTPIPKSVYRHSQCDLTCLDIGVRNLGRQS